MLPIQSILVALDLTPEGDLVWQEACALARAHGAELHLVHAVADLDLRSPALPDALSGAETRLLALRRVATEQGLRVAPGVLACPGDAARTILRAALDLDVDLVVIGASPRSPKDRALLGLTAERVVRGSTVPVWIVRPGRPHDRIERVVALVDATEPRRDVIHAAGLIARPARLGLTVLSLTPEGAHGRELLERVRRAVGGTAAESLDVEVYTRPVQRPAAELLAVAERDSVDLLVLGEPQARGLLRERSHLVEELLRAAPCSILLVPRAPTPAEAGSARG